jgi:hypothetical protein
MAELLGDDYKLFYDTASSFGTPTWVEEIGVGDIGFDTANEQVNIPKRTSHKLYKKGRSDLKFSFKMNVDVSSTFHKAVIGAINTGTKIHLAIAPGAIASGGYWHGWFLLNGPLDASLDSAATYDVECKVHADDTSMPAFVTWS